MSAELREWTMHPCFRTKMDATTYESVQRILTDAYAMDLADPRSLFLAQKDHERQFANQATGRLIGKLALVLPDQSPGTVMLGFWHERGRDG